MIINRINSNPYNNRNNSGKKNNLNFAGNNGSRAFNWLANQCEMTNSGSMKRLTFLFVGLVFMGGARFKDARGNDEKREIVTRDIPAMTVAAYGAPMFNNAIAYAATKRTGIPVIQFAEGKRKNALHAEFITQKQVKDWYSDFSGLKNPLVTLSETVEKHGGNIKKFMARLGLDEELQAISSSSSNAEILEDLKKAKGSEGFNALEEKIKSLKVDNKVLKTARNIQASIKLGSIAIASLFLGILIPRLNIVTTRKKYQHQQQNHNKAAQNTKSLNA